MEIPNFYQRRSYPHHFHDRRHTNIFDHSVIAILPQLTPFFGKKALDSVSYF